MLLKVAGTDATKHFKKYHDVEKILKTVAVDYKLGPLSSNATNAIVPHKTASSLSSTLVPNKTASYVKAEAFDIFGDNIPYADPSWYQGHYTPYYNETHVALRKEIRDWVEEHVEPYVDEWDATGEIDPELYHKFGQAGYLSLLTGSKDFPSKYTNLHPKSVKPEEIDVFHEYIVTDEMCRPGSGGVVWNLFGGYSIGLPPVLKFASEDVRSRIVPSIIAGEKRICLCITEPDAGSDVANLTTTAEKTADGKYYIVNGAKKWITNGIWSDYFSVAVRTGENGMNGISMLLLEKTMPGIQVRKIETQGMRTSGSTYITFEDVKVPVGNLIGKENKGFRVIMTNFNHERLGIIMQALRFSRVLYEEATKHAHQRETFGQKLVKHDVIRNKLGQMAIRIEALQNWLDNLLLQCQMFSDEEAMLRLGGHIAGGKAYSSQTMEFCAREASQIFGGLAYTRGGKGGKVERLYREVRAYAIPGGSEEIMIDLAMRQSLKVHQFLGSKL